MGCREPPRAFSHGAGMSGRCTAAAHDCRPSSAATTNRLLGMLTLVLTRHGLTDRSTPEQHLGQRIDISINDAGRRQAQALAHRLSAVRFDRVLTSPLFRAREPAEILAPGMPIEADPRLKEMDYGAWEGLTYTQLDERDSALRREWELAPDRLACPGGESGNDVA